MKIVRSLLTFLYTLAIYVGLPLLGWGFDDLPGFFSFPPLIGYSASIAAFGLLAGFMLQRPSVPWFFCPSLIPGASESCLAFL